jgi:HSP20 family protein
MAIVRWEPVRELRLLNSLFDTPTFPQSASRRWIPAIDLLETEGEFVLRADLPGLAEQDVNIELEDNVLTLSGERKSEHEERKQGYYRAERSSGSFRRTLTLPEGVDADAVKATFDRGVLEITVPKPEQRKPRKVQITVAGGSEPQAIEGSEPTPTAAA